MSLSNTNNIHYPVAFISDPQTIFQYLMDIELQENIIDGRGRM